MDNALIGASGAHGTDPVSQSRLRRWAGLALSALSVLSLTASAVMKLTHAPEFVAAWTDHLGYAERTLTPIGILEAACVLVYAIPRTAVLGAILLTAYLGGAVATHVRVGDPFVTPIVLGVLVWVGLYLRDPRVGELAPLQSSRSASR
ncbi:MAG TPA: DoxX family protein [Labilithrix sp.]|nr:DoxX family protein [Labilithrix sp.]